MDKTKAIEVGVVMGSDSDWPLLKQTASTLDSFGVGYEVRVISAHRSPATATAYAGEAPVRGLKVIIAAAGGAAHLAGVLAAHTILPVIGVPVKGGAMDGLDALLSTVQMPAGIPVGTVALGNAGAINAAIFAVQILAVGNPQLTQRLLLHKRSLAEKVAAADEKIQSELNAPKA